MAWNWVTGPIRARIQFDHDLDATSNPTSDAFDGRRSNVARVPPAPAVDVAFVTANTIDVQLSAGGPDPGTDFVRYTSSLAAAPRKGTNGIPVADFNLPP